MNEPSVDFPGLRRVGRTLIAAGLFGYSGFLALDFLMPIEAPQKMREDRFHLGGKPQIHTQSKAPAYLELSDGGVPARVPNFHSIESEATRQQLLSLQPGTEVIVLRPAEASTWFNAYDILALRVGHTSVLTVESTLSAHDRHANSSRAVTLYIAVLGVLLLLVRRWLVRQPDAA